MFIFLNLKAQAIKEKNLSEQVNTVFFLVSNKIDHTFDGGYFFVGVYVICKFHFLRIENLYFS